MTRDEFVEFHVERGWRLEGNQLTLVNYAGARLTWDLQDKGAEFSQVDPATGQTLHIGWLAYYKANLSRSGNLILPRVFQEREAVARSLWSRMARPDSGRL